jgi:hypothetical protein
VYAADQLDGVRIGAWGHRGGDRDRDHGVVEVAAARGGRTTKMISHGNDVHIAAAD